MSRMLPFAAGGVGLAALENRMVGENLPEPLKRVNLGVGATTGALLASHNPEAQIAALSGIPLKEMALFGIGGLDKMRRSQQGLVDTNLMTAKTNLHTARLQGADAGSRKALALSFLLPALAAGGGLGYMAYDRYKKNHPSPGRFNTVASQGKPVAHQKVRIDIPPSALPKDFFTSLSGLGDNPRSFSRLEDNSQPPVNRNRKKSENMKKAALWKKASPHPGLLSTLGNVAWELTGLPSFSRSMSDTSNAFRNLQQGDTHEALRYGAGALGGAALGLTSLRGLTLPLAGKLLGKARLGGVISRGEGGLMSGGLRRQFTEMPTFAKPIFNHTFGNELGPRLNSAGEIAETAAERMIKRKAIGAAGSPGAVSRMSRGPMDRMLDIRGRYDPNAFAWDNPTPATQSGFKSLFNKYLTNPAGRTKPPPMGLPGQILNVGRYGVNRLANAGYALNQFGKQNPNLRLMALGMPLQNMGIASDQERLEKAKENLHGYQPDFMNNKGTYGMPVSSALSGLLGSVTGTNPDQGLADQVGGTRHDPYRYARLAGNLF